VKSSTLDAFPASYWYR